MKVAFEEINSLCKFKWKSPNDKIAKRVKKSWSKVESIAVTMAKKQYSYPHPILSHLVVSYLNQCADTLRSLHMHAGELSILKKWNYLTEWYLNLQNESNIPVHLEEICLHVPGHYHSVLMGILSDEDCGLQRILSRISICIDGSIGTRETKAIAKMLDYQLWMAKCDGSLRCIQWVIQTIRGTDVSYLLIHVCELMLVLLQKHSEIDTRPVMVVKIHILIPQYDREQTAKQIAKSIPSMQRLMQILVQRFAKIMFCFKVTLAHTSSVSKKHSECYYITCLPDIVAVLKDSRQLGCKSVTSEVQITSGCAFVAKLTVQTSKTYSDSYESASWLTNCSFCCW